MGTEYVYELPASWVNSGHRASLAIDPLNRLEETDESDNAAVLTMDGHAAPVFDVTFVPIVFSGDPPEVDADTYMAVIGDLLPTGEYRARVGRTLDLSDRNLGTFDRELSRDTALSELLHLWNAEAGEGEYYHGLMSTAEQSIVIGGFGVFGGVALQGGKVAVSDVIGGRCQVEREFCGDGVHAHELGHNFGLAHLPGRCTGPGAVDHDFPYAEAGIGPRRGWVATRNEFVNPESADPHYDVMGYCAPRFVSDYNYNKMVDHRLEGSPTPGDNTGRIGPSLTPGSSAAPTKTLVAQWSTRPPQPAEPAHGTGCLLDQALVGYLQPVMQPLDHRQCQIALPVQHFGHAPPRADIGLQVPSVQLVLFHQELDGFDRIGRRNREVLLFVTFDKEHQNVQFIAFCRAGFRPPQFIDALQRTVQLDVASDGLEFHDRSQMCSISFIASYCSCVPTKRISIPCRS